MHMKHTDNKRSLVRLKNWCAGAAAVTLTAICATNAVAQLVQPFTPGNLVIYRVGNGSSAPTSASTPVFLDEYTTAGALVQSVPMPTNGVGTQNPLTASGTATSEGLLNRSVDGRYLIFTGYATNATLPSVASTSSSTNARVIGRLGAMGNNLDTSTALGDWASANNPRSAISVDGTAFWGAGANGDNYAPLGATTSTSLITRNSRAINIFNNQLYFSSSSGGFLVATLGTGLPTTTGQTAVNIPGITTTTSPYVFVFET